MLCRYDGLHGSASPSRRSHQFISNPASCCANFDERTSSSKQRRITQTSSWPQSCGSHTVDTNHASSISYPLKSLEYRIKNLNKEAFLRWKLWVKVFVRMWRHDHLEREQVAVERSHWAKPIVFSKQRLIMSFLSGRRALELAEEAHSHDRPPQIPLSLRLILPRATISLEEGRGRMGGACLTSRSFVSCQHLLDESLHSTTRVSTMFAHSS